MILDSPHRVRLPARPNDHWEMLDWCKDHLTGRVGSLPVYQDTDLWYFDTAEEATMFALRWA